MLPLKSLSKVDAVVLFVSRTILSIPEVGKLVKKIYSARFASTLSILYSSILSLINCVNYTSNVIGNAHITEKLEDVSQELITGNTLSESIESIDVFDPLLPGMIKVGVIKVLKNKNGESLIETIISISLLQSFQRLFLE